MATERNPLELIASNPIELSIVSIKSKLMMIISQIIKENKWSQTIAADRLCVNQPRISNLMNGKISYFSIDMLLEMLGKLGYIIDIGYDPSNSLEPVKMRFNKSIV